MLRWLTGKRAAVVVTSDDPNADLPELPFPSSFAQSVALIRKNVPTKGIRSNRLVFQSSAGLVIAPEDVAPPDAVITLSHNDKDAESKVIHEEIHRQEGTEEGRRSNRPVSG